MKKDILNETFNKHTFLLKKKLYEQGVIQQQPIQEVELEEGLKDIALAALLGLGTLFTTTSKADTASPTNQPAVSVSSEINRVKSAKQKAEGVATEIAKKMIEGNNFSKSSAQKILDDVIKFNKDHKFGSAAQMKISIEHAESNSRHTDKEKPSNEGALFGSIPDGIGNVIGTDILNKIQNQADELSKQQAELLIKKYNTQDEYAQQRVRRTCYYSAIGDFVQMIAQKLVQVATRP